MVAVVILCRDTDNLLFRDSPAYDAGLFGILYCNSVKFHNIFPVRIKINAEICGQRNQRNICGINQADILLHVIIDIADDDEKYRSEKLVRACCATKI